MPYILLCTLCKNILSIFIIIAVCDCDHRLLNGVAWVGTVEKDECGEGVVNQESHVVGLDVLNHSINFVSNRRLDIDSVIAN